MSGSLLLVVAVATNIGLAGILPCFFLVVASMGLISPNAVALALQDHPKIAGSASGLMGVLQFLIGGIVSPLVGIGGSSSAWPLAVVMAVVSVGGLLIFTLLTGPKTAAGFESLNP
jgi:DHA1 family bicyclomycin/chloramphenicol resistance-like MFS transporter